MSQKLGRVLVWAIMDLLDEIQLVYRVMNSPKFSTIGTRPQQETNVAERLSC